MSAKQSLFSGSAAGGSCCAPESVIREAAETEPSCCSSSPPDRRLEFVVDRPSSTEHRGRAISLSDQWREMANALGRAAKIVTYPVVLTLVIFLALAILQPSQATATAVFILEAIWAIFPFLVISVALAAAATATNADGLVGRAFLGREGRSVLIGAAIGALSPFCSCGVVPVIAAFLMSGVPLAPVMAFWISSPIVDPEMFALVWGGLGLEFAVVKTIAAIAMGVLAGYATMAFVRLNGSQDLLKINLLRSCGCSASTMQDGPVWQFWRYPERVKVFRGSFEGNTWFLGRWLIFAFTLESLMVAYIPGDAVAGILHETGVWAIPLSVLVGVPTYLNGYAAIPLVSGMIKLGVSPAVGLGFMLGGAVTSLPAAMAVWVLAKPKLFALYLLLCFTGSLASAYAYAIFLTI